METAKKNTRRYSEVTADTNFTFKMQPQKYDTEQSYKRKASEDCLKGKMGAEQKEDFHKKNLQAKCNYKLSTQILSFQLQEQRCSQLKTILSTAQLNAYFNTLKRLFMILYQTSHLIMENIFRINHTILSNNNLKLIEILLEKDSSAEWNVQYVNKLQVLAKNIAFLSTNSAEFQRRIEHVAIKVCLHNTKRPVIQKAFLNNKIQKYWKNLEQRYNEHEIFPFIEDQFQRAQEKLCFIEFQHFVKTRLSTESFGNKIHKYCTLQQIDFDMNFNFSFEFFLVEELCFNESEYILQDVEEKQQFCEIM